jgi:hypothetical protein
MGKVRVQPETDVCPVKGRIHSPPTTLNYNNLMKLGGSVGNVPQKMKNLL